MRRVIVVAVREYKAAVKSKAFIISLVAMPVIMGGSVAVQLLLKDRVDTEDKRVVILDRTGRLYDVLGDAAQKRNETEIFEGEAAHRKKVKPRFLVEPAVEAPEDDAEAKLQLSEKVREGDITAFVFIPASALESSRETAEGAIAYHSNTPTYRDLRRWVEREGNNQIRRQRLAAVALDPEVVERATRPVPVANLGLVELDEEGRITQAEESSEIANIMVPLTVMMLMFMVIMIGASPLMHSVLEEKMQRIAEVLLGSVPPFQLMLGKLLGMVGVSLTLFVFYLGGAFAAVSRSGYAEMFPAHLVWWFVVFQTLAVLMFGSLFIAIGAAVSDLKEGNSLMTPVMLFVVAPMFVWVNVVQHPMSSFALTLSLVPPATPMLMVIRLAVQPDLPIWQPLVGVVFVLVTTVLCVFAAGRIFRVGILMQGKGANVTEMLRWVIRG